MDVTQIILQDHAEQRRLFAAINEIDPSDTEALTAVWGRLKALLDSHAEAEERFFYPDLLKTGTGAADADDAEEETRDAIGDHNEIRDTGEKVQNYKVGTPEWFSAVAACEVANSDHMGEEERQGLADFRKRNSLEERHKLGVRFLAFQCAHLTGVPVKDKDVDDYVEDPAQTLGNA
ncbi:hemerythrin domain-containing protein [Stappia sp. BW2]|jgi:hypothetical protein|uniref:hemerythrin domain-containing protein n=1 Tax=Stappia sp. BW2 TaxID=2592622 RepID=UPI0011DEE996|nr:hemerythrin domain-containing protein [Stappia sp. BW2]TYC64053.1 hemerythrin domain-containing protein [Stappia sp. BW2]